MSTSKPRVQVLLTPEVLEVYARAARLSGISASKLAGEVLKEAAPAIDEMAALLHKAKDDQAGAGSRVAEGMVALANKARSALDAAQFDLEDEIATRKASKIDPEPLSPKSKPKPKPKAKTKPKA